MTVAVCVPYRPRNPHEERLWSWCEQRWRALFPDWQICVADSGDEPFNRSASRNAAAEQAIAGGADVVCFANADTFVYDHESLSTAVDVCRSGGWVLPANYVEVTESLTAEILGLDPGAPVPDPLSSYERQLPRSPAGPQIVPVEGFERVNRWDETYEAWGKDDDSLRDALDVLWSPHTRALVAVHLWHPRTAEDSFRAKGYPKNRQRHMQLYGRAVKQRTPEKRRELMLRAIAGNRG